MVSAIDPTKPLANVPASKADFRANAAAAKNEIEAAQQFLSALFTSLGLGEGVNQFPALGGNAPNVQGNLLAILNSFNQEITNAKNSGNGGSSTLGGISDILDPNNDVRAAFGEPVDGGNFNSDFTFAEANHANRWLKIDNAGGDVTLTLPPENSIAQADGPLFGLLVTSSSNRVTITGANNNEIRYQSGRVGDPVIATSIFAGLSENSGSNALLVVHKDGGAYRVRGMARHVANADTRINAPGSIPGSAIQSASLLAAAFPNILNLGGTKQAGGARDIVRNVGGTTALSQADAGNIVRLTGAGAATWTVPDLAEGTTIELRSKAGAGAITIDAVGSLPVSGGLVINSGTSGAIRFYNDEIEMIGTV